MSEAPCATFVNGTECVHGGVSPDPKTGAILTPIYQSTTFKQPSVDDYLSLGFSYSRSGNPTVSALEKKIAQLEGASQPACAFSTGMAATHCLFASFLKTGDHVVITQCSYGGTNRAARVLYEKQYGIEFTFVDMTDLEAVRKAVIPGRTKMIFSETPCNPTLQLADLSAISAIAREFSDKNPTPLQETLKDGDGPSWECVNGRVLHVSDTTLATPVVTRGLDHGVDVVLISITKFYCGHNMFLGGALCTNDPGLYELIHFKQNVMGSIISPDTAFHIMQTCKTLVLRVTKQSANAMAIAEFLSTHPKVLSVSYPGLPSHPQHEIALKQHQKGIHGGMLCFEVRGGCEAGRRVMNATCRPWTLAENLGSTESILTCPAVFTHGNMPREMRLAVHITDGLMRLSVGIEEPADLIKALDKALEAA
eukprot:Gregarina_sp_Poly_1__6547@NODE_350_length_9319_cov_183_335387_g293_i0_p3_GENE_NODE_350_length_9319_cov_183_335387_g293_i0NODE_350_length_9319_cov_183_335387_g293_i0_p3_ORF_typecomplete_len423_score51_55Cys_Met_Meta_PP/PF01053_20/1_1e109Aminotran_1_2/PF00155_21/2_9e09Beta_elim_lyase/PF01212_21/7e06Beta_elim_lyase/PF01212_21/1_9DegT_DnrJ_EryC1/PF01041_17/3_9e08Aminotran_5/PF00266_19/2_6e08_NODE_350_length_9319_cov_183_335387_g293_i037585026